MLLMTLIQLEIVLNINDFGWLRSEGNCGKCKRKMEKTNEN
jgi:hypothetical protein